ncbi:hypothetical protein BO82DRAFT_351831 [Aspergillus uvarum CBS 121591]|uniref:Uncharacterized protein n=1 Tax=Aspergillus uvarum CBS 121591 TaxID=1448315 RepID=A0A319E0L9_9EURO|nr:hypothetical protein BO82DRAFT_351831 [Aspergillus uvarum CBS 121591]PYH84642.1 hypothetical protein BO82DRAFT_351831 [Aspergillus uvarum CBS 121591]
MTTPTFPSFSRLPAEIRLMFWEAALLDPIDKPLFFWRRTPWRPEEYLIGMAGDLIHPDDMGRSLSILSIYDRLICMQMTQFVSISL